MRSRIHLFCLVFVPILLIVGCSGGGEYDFVIEGRIKNHTSGSIFLFREDDINRKQRTLIGSLPINGDGSFRIGYNLEPHVYSLNFYDKAFVTLAIDKGQKIVINADATDLSGITVSGSQDTDLLKAYEDFRKASLDRLVISIRKQITQFEADPGASSKEEYELLGEREVTNYEEHKKELNRFISEKMGSSIAVYSTTLRWEGEQNLEFFEKIAGAFEKMHPRTAVAKRVREKVELIRNTSIGGSVPGILMPDPSGNRISLTAMKARYTLIDFWASWCGPCRRESKILNEVYAEYKDRGFEIYGVSLDDSEAKWLDAIDKDGRIWTNVSTLQGFETPATFEYGVTAIPAKFLVDQNGMIMEKDLHGEKIRETLMKLFADDRPDG